MKIKFKKSFLKDIEKIKDKNIKYRILKIIEEVKSAEKLKDIKNIKKLRVGENYYRITISAYRIGLICISNLLIFVRVLHRKDIYKYFP